MTGNCLQVPLKLRGLPSGKLDHGAPVNRRVQLDSQLGLQPLTIRQHAKMCAVDMSKMRRVTLPTRAGFRQWLWVALPLAVHALLCSVHLASIAQTPLLRHLVVDLARYHRWATEIAQGAWIGQGVFYQDPLYPYLMAILYKLTLPDIRIVLVAQIIMSVLTLWCMYRIARRLYSPVVARVALWAAALYAPNIYYAVKPEKACLAALGMALTVWLVLVALERQKNRYWVMFGLVCALFSLVRGNALGLLVLVTALRPLLDEGNRRFWYPTLAIVLGAGLVLGPVTLRNWMAGGDLVITTAQLGPNLYIGNHADNHTGTYVIPSDIRATPPFEQQDFHRLAERETGRALKPSEVSHHFVGKVIDWAATHPVDFLELSLLKLEAFLHAYEIPDNWSIYFVSEWSPVLRLPLLRLGWVYPLAIMGLIYSLISGLTKQRIWFLVLLSAYSASVIAFFVNSRYRFPIAFGLLVLAAHGAVMSIQLVGNRRWRQLALASVFGLVSLIITCSGNRFDPSGDLSHRFVNLAQTQLNQGYVGQAQHWLSRAIEIKPGSPGALAVQFRVHVLRDQFDAQASLLERLLEIAPDAENTQLAQLVVDSQRKTIEELQARVETWLEQRESYRLRCALIEIAWRQQRLDVARAQLGQLQLIYPNDGWALEKDVILSLEEAGLENLPDKIRALPESAYRRSLEANLIDRNQATHRALEPYQLIRNPAPVDDLFELHAKTAFLIQAGALTAARSLLEREIESGNRQSWFFYKLSQVHYLFGHRAEAIASARRAVLLAPDNYAYRDLLGQLTQSAR